MPKHFIAVTLLTLLSACTRSYITPVPSVDAIPFAQPMETLPPTALFQAGNSVATQTPAVVTPTAAIVCSEAPAPHVDVGQQVTVIVEDWDKLKLRSTPEISSASVVMELAQYSQLRILDGPVCVTDPDTKISYLFWKVAVIPSGELGWVAEGDSSHYFIE